MPSRIPTSRAYWNLRAEQVLDRVFNDDENVLNTVQVEINPQAQLAEARHQKTAGLSWQQVSLAALGLLAVLGSSALTLHWRLTQQALEREGNLALIERLRNNQPASIKTSQNGPTPETSPKTAEAALTDETSTPTELEIAALPNASTTQLEQITIPLPSAEFSSNATIADQSSAVTPQPQLVGVVHAGNGDGSAIFQFGNLSLSTVPGEAIGNSGWTLQSVSANGAVIERSGATQSLSVGGAF